MDVSTQDDLSHTAAGVPGHGPMTLFSFGYWGAGSAALELVRAVDAAEALRGYEPPLWVDIRASRSVRAAGFRDGRFAGLLQNRYVWLPGLGNKRILEHRDGIEIKNSVAAKDLLQYALDNPQRRVVFFCSCEHPTHCHRTTVGQLVLKTAMQQKARVEIIEWPGGEPDRVTFDASPAILHKIARGTVKNIAIPSSMSVGAAVSVPWGTMATVQAGTERVSILIGPAHFNAAGPRLRVFSDKPGTPTNAKSFRTEFGYSKLVGTKSAYQVSCT